MDFVGSSNKETTFKQINQYNYPKPPLLQLALHYNILLKQM